MTILGIGLDATDIPRVEKAIARYGDRFIHRIFTDAEIAYCSGKYRPAPHYAGRFAAKEAFSKALGTGLRGAIGWTEIDVIDNERMRPTIRVMGRAEKILAGRKVHLSISHLPDYATAIVIIED